MTGTSFLSIVSPTSRYLSDISGYVMVLAALLRPANDKTAMRRLGKAARRVVLVHSMSSLIAISKGSPILDDKLREQPTSRY